MAAEDHQQTPDLIRLNKLLRMIKRTNKELAFNATEVAKAEELIQGLERHSDVLLETRRSLIDEAQEILRGIEPSLSAAVAARELKD